MQHPGRLDTKHSALGCPVQGPGAQAVVGEKTVGGTFL